MARHKRLFSKDNPLSRVTEEPKAFGDKDYALGMKPPVWSSRAQRNALADALEQGKDIESLRARFSNGGGMKRG